jgi:hypothetical protein
MSATVIQCLLGVFSVVLSGNTFNYQQDLLPDSRHDTDLEASDSRDGEYDPEIKTRLRYVEGFKVTIAEHELPEPFCQGSDPKLPPKSKKLDCVVTDPKTVPLYLLSGV